MVRKTEVSFYAGQDLIDKVGEYSYQHDISQSKAMRELIRRGLQTEVAANE